MSEIPNPQEPSAYRPSPFVRGSLILHTLGLATLAMAPRRRKQALGALMANHLVLSLAGMAPRSTLLGPNLVRLPKERLARPSVALTFDDGPDPEVTPKILELLEAAGAKASFFPIARRAERFPGLVSEILERGHRIENHTFSHPNGFAFRGPRGLMREIDRAQEALIRLGAPPPRYFRAPAGIRNPFLDPVLHARGLRLASWSRRGFDTVERRAERVLERLLRNLRTGDILLLHDGNSAKDPEGRPVVLGVLPDLLAVLAERHLAATLLP